MKLRTTKEILDMIGVDITNPHYRRIEAAIKDVRREAIEAAVEVAKVKDVTHLSIGATEKKFIVDKQSILSLLNK